MSQQADNVIWNKEAFPQKINEDEDILLVTREDIALLVFRTFGIALIFLAILAARTIFATLISQPLFIALLDVIVYGSSLLLVIAFALVFHNYYLSMQIVTSDRVIDIDQKGLFRREVNELSVDNIEDVTYKQNGFWSMILGYGNVIVKTAASASESPESNINGFVFENVPDPTEIAATITNLYHESKEGDRQKDAQMNAEEIRKAFNPDLYK